ncbi:MAG: SpoIIIAH-like protein [Pelotomaculum sp. PtaB.Bin013]|uniref:SpoIIIAH-like family protein n=1 Tax=Pelotomaculum isophthalicicum JI TaxID=947010 RepID=A0A9X4H770_9FIRM|nr:SpoIIIAH-like family protein [Pelotomaculum isophthalicicum]MDF9407489.1 SpoIIIAH-like family protein [Pelotomaculum isophthalicicum JI]OPX91990.1 MAG: SpoIIIAH-like protein [Pelotomaculum sp. PtaB.Bin013]
MKTVIINKKILSLTVLSVIGVAVLLLCRYGAVKVSTIISDTRISIPAAGEVRINNAGTAPGNAGTVPGGQAAGDLKEKNIQENNSNFYVEYRLARERTRGQRVEWLREVINNVNSSSETRQKAQDSLLSISSSMEKEVEIENLIKAKGYDDAAVLIDSRSVTAVIATDNLNPEETVRLAELISRGTGIDSSNILIIAKL